MKAPLFSIITITRNNVDGLQKTCESVRGQNFDDYQWMVIDGASTDGSVDYLGARGVSFISEPDQGLYDAMNKGLDHAIGRYVVFMNAGDCFANKEVLSEIASLLENLKAAPDFIYGDALETRPGQCPAYKPARPFTQAEKGLFTHHQAMFYRSERIGALRYDLKFPVAADYKFTLEFLSKDGPAVLYCPFPICLYEAGGLSQQQAARGRREQMVIRTSLGTVTPWHNRLIALKQTAAWAFRRTFPDLYWRLRQP